MVIYSATRVALLASACVLLTACNRPVDSITPQANQQDPNSVQLTQAAAELAKISSSPVTTRSDCQSVETTGQIKADENRVFHINSIVAGRVVKDNIVLGNSIKQGEELAVIQNLDVAKTYGQYIHEAHQNEMNIDQTQAKLELAKKNLDRLNRLNKEGIVAEKDLLLAENQEKLLQIELRGYEEHSIHIKGEAKALLSAYGVDLDGPGATVDPAKIQTGSPLLSPRGGVVIQKNVTVGDVVNPSEPLYVVADLSSVWLDIAIYDKDLEKIKEGESVVFNSDSLPGLPFAGQISYIKPSTGDASRTFLARAALPNPKLVLKPGMFGQVKITGFGGKPLPYLPDQALQKFDNENFVFIDKGNNLYQRRRVELGNRVSDGFLVSSGINAGEMIVEAGSFKLKSEMLKARIGSDD